MRAPARVRVPRPCQSTLFSTLFGAVPGPLMWGLLAGTPIGQQGTFLVLSFIPLLALPLCFALWARLKGATQTAATATAGTAAAAAEAAAAQSTTAAAASSATSVQLHREKLLQVLVRAAALPDDGKARQQALNALVRRCVCGARVVE